MKLQSIIPAAAAFMLLATACGTDSETEVYDERDDMVLDEPIYDEPATTYEAPDVVETAAPASDRADEPTTTSVMYPGLMPDEIRYRNSEGVYNWDAVPTEDIDGLNDY